MLGLVGLRGWVGLSGVGWIVGLGVWRCGVELVLVGLVGL